MPVRLMMLGALLILKKRISFLETFHFLGRISLFPAFILYVRDSLEYLGTSLFPFLIPRKGMIQVYIRIRNIF